ncbi:hypothetical protein GQ457_13G027020 [Hibiscus cannabinus]
MIKSLNLNFHGPASTVEVSALFEGLEFAIANVWPSTLVESDAAVLVNKLHRPTVDLSLLGDLLAPSPALLDASSGYLRVGFASRSSNTAAHALASWACHNDNALVESDAAILVNKLHRPTVDLSLLRDLLAPSRTLLDASSGRLRVGFASRSANTAAHALASWACHNDNVISLSSVCPELISRIVLDDLSSSF